MEYQWEAPKREMERQKKILDGYIEDARKKEEEFLHTTWRWRNLTDPLHIMIVSLLPMLIVCMIELYRLRHGLPELLSVEKLIGLMFLSFIAMFILMIVLIACRESKRKRLKKKFSLLYPSEGELLGWYYDRRR